MAKHKKHTKSPRSHALVIRRTASKPIVIKQTKVVKAKHHRRPKGGGGMSFGGIASGKRIAVAVGAAALGFAEKQAFYKSIPALPMVGVMGTIAVGAYLLSDGGKMKLADDICTAAIALAAHELTSAAKVVGVDGEEEYHPGIGYVAGY